MILKVHSDVSYLSEPKASSQIGGHFYFGSPPSTSTDKNGYVLNTSEILHNDLSSEDEAEYGGLFENTRSATDILNILHQCVLITPLPMAFPTKQ